MASSFDRWEKDPFFNAAEEVQESADRYYYYYYYSHYHSSNYVLFFQIQTLLIILNLNI